MSTLRGSLADARGSLTARTTSGSATARSMSVARGRETLDR